MLQNLSVDEAMNEIQFIKSLQLINQMKEAGLINEKEHEEIRDALIETYGPYLGELMR